MANLTLIQAQQRYIERVNSAKTAKIRAGRTRRAANVQLHDYCVSIGITDTAQILQIKRDAWDMAELEYNSED